jgi:CcmD family protein
MKFLNLLQPAEMADIMRADGKIYVVVAGLVILLLGVLFYLFSLDRKITKLEKEVENSKRP